MYTLLKSLSSAKASPALPHGHGPQFARQLWGNRWARPALAIAVQTPAWVLVAVMLPRGSATSAQVLAVMALGLVVGVASGLLLRSRWADDWPGGCWASWGLAHETDGLA